MSSNLSDKLRKCADSGEDIDIVTYNTFGISNRNQFFKELADYIDMDYIVIPKDSYGIPWYIGDMCMTFSGRKGSITAYGENGNVLVKFYDNEFHWYNENSLKRI